MSVVNTNIDSLQNIQEQLDEVSKIIEDYLEDIQTITEQEKNDRKTSIDEKIQNLDAFFVDYKNKKNLQYINALASFDTIRDGYSTAIRFLNQNNQTKSFSPQGPVVLTKEEKLAQTIPFLSYIYTLLKKTVSINEKAKLYSKIGNYHQKQAIKEMEEHHLKSLVSWSSAKENYELAVLLNSKNEQSINGCAESMKNLAKYNSTINFLNKYSSENDQYNNKDYYKVTAVAQRKLFNYSEAKKLLEKNSDKDFAQKELKLIENLEKNTNKSRIQTYKEQINDIKVENYEKRQQCSTYRILSIDGGGIRGIIPAYLVSEIEKRTHLPISHSFNLLAGTSTGGIISAGLSLPKHDNTFTPQYRAYDILDIYLNQANRIFKKNFNLFGLNLFNSTYSEEGRLDLFKQYFGQNTLSKSLTELVIPAADEGNLFTTYLFNRYDAKTNLFRDDTYIDALMATSAAPTYFPSHYIEGKGLFNDGGIHVNNPTNLACSEAIRYGADRNNIKVLSLGTGTYVPDKIKQSPFRGLLFWAANLHEIALEAQVGNADIIVSNMLGKERYQRWQIWFENPVTLDDYGEKNINFLLESANQLIEEFDASDDNNINKIVEDILHE